ncbi:unnamed protein product [Meganyctiphanes norvegica]|uniref:Uncharacterized protein n=2 Tax=Meganyctiphanes norvegica TaxID=48144 RepID=A0AAV2PKA9_MEGNR
MSKIKMTHSVVLIALFFLLCSPTCVRSSVEGEALIKSVKHGEHSKAMDLINNDTNVNYQDKEGFTPLYWAANRGYKKLAVVLIGRGASVDHKVDDGWTPLMTASGRDHPEVVETLIKAGASVDDQNDSGNSALHLAANRNNPEVAKLLVTAGAPIQQQNKEGYTPLHWAAYLNNKEVAQILLQAGASTNIQTLHQETPLTLAVRRDSTDTALTILNYCPNTSIKGWENQSALETAHKKGNGDIVRYLTELHHPCTFNYIGYRLDEVRVEACILQSCNLDGTWTQLPRSNPSCDCFSDGSVFPHGAKWSTLCHVQVCNNGKIEITKDTCCRVGDKDYPQGTTWENGCIVFTCESGVVVQKEITTICKHIMNILVDGGYPMNGLVKTVT